MYSYNQRLTYVCSVVLFVAAVHSGLVGRAQDSNSSASTDIKSLIEAQRFIIDVQSVSPLRGGIRQLSPSYIFSVTPDTVSTELPYFGRAYQASINPSDAGIKFTSLSYQYTVKEKKRGGWDINIKPKDVPKVPQINLSVSPNGTTSIRITPTDRQSISYSGKMKSIK